MSDAIRMVQLPAAAIIWDENCTIMASKITL